MAQPAIQANPPFCAPPRPLHSAATRLDPHRGGRLAADGRARPTDLRSTPRADDQGGVPRAAMGDALAFAFSDRLRPSSTQSRIDTPLLFIGKEYSRKA